MRISDWSSDVCSSDLARRLAGDDAGDHHRLGPAVPSHLSGRPAGARRRAGDPHSTHARGVDGESLAGGKAGETRTGCRAYRPAAPAGPWRSEEHTSELQSLMRNSYAVFCLKKQKNIE